MKPEFKISDIKIAIRSEVQSESDVLRGHSAFRSMTVNFGIPLLILPL